MQSCNSYAYMWPCRPDTPPKAPLASICACGLSNQKLHHQPKRTPPASSASNSSPNLVGLKVASHLIVEDARFLPRLVAKRPQFPGSAVCLILRQRKVVLECRNVLLASSLASLSLGGRWLMLAAIRYRPHCWGKGTQPWRTRTMVKISFQRAPYPERHWPEGRKKSEADTGDEGCEGRIASWSHCHGFPRLSAPPPRGTRTRAAPFQRDCGRWSRAFPPHDATTPIDSMPGWPAWQHRASLAKVYRRSSVGLANRKNIWPRRRIPRRYSLGPRRSSSTTFGYVRRWLCRRPCWVAILSTPQPRNR